MTRRSAPPLCLLATAALAILTPAAPADTLHVPAQYPTIQAAIDAAVPGDVVELADGTYSGPGNRDLDYQGKAITVRSASGDPAACIVDCGGSWDDPYGGFYFHSGEGPDSKIEGITITNGYMTPRGGGVACYGSSPTLINCWITGNRASSFYSGEGGGLSCSDSSNPTLIDCTISGNAADGGSSGYGGGVYCSYDSNPTLTNCTISGNTAEGSGGGVYCLKSSPTLIDCTLSENTAGGGGGIHCYWSSNATLTNCTISGNVADSAGGVACSKQSAATFTNCTIAANSSTNSSGGLRCHSSAPTLTNCTISGNLSCTGGGVVCEYDASPTFIDCTISGNEVQGGYCRGGGVSCDDGHPTFTNCTICGNKAQGYSARGGGVCCINYSSPLLTNCTISGNSCDYYGGGIACSKSSPTLVNCTVSRNVADSGGGLHCYWGDAPTLTNCTMVANSAVSGAALSCDSYLHSYPSVVAVSNSILWNGVDQVWNADGSAVTLTYCDVQGGWAGAGNLDADPLFADPDGPDGDPATWEDNDYRLAGGSPCIDAADDTAVPADTADLDDDGNTAERTPLDLGGAPRFLDDPATDDTGVSDPPGYPEVVDMGAYEYFVDCDGNGVPDLSEEWLLEAVSVCSGLSHDEAGEFCLALLGESAASSIEPRAAGVRKLVCRMNVSADPATVIADHVQVACLENEYAGTIAASLEDADDCPASAVILAFDPALPNRDCCWITLDGMTTAYGQPGAVGFAVRTLAGDIDRSGTVSSVDASSIKPRFGAKADDAQFLYDLDGSGTVSSVDASFVKPRFGHSAPECP